MARDDDTSADTPESESYKRIYRFNESDTTKPREFAHEVALEREAEDVESLRDQLQQLRTQAEGRVQFWPNVGKFIVPPVEARDTFAAHLQLVKSPEMGLSFTPATYPYFDKILAERAGRPELFDPAHPEYARHEALRNNLAVLRNDIMGVYMDDGSFDPGDEKFVPFLADIAREIGDALSNKKTWFGRAFGARLDEEILALEGEGGVHLYDFLLKRQRGHGFLADIASDIYHVTGIPLRRWDLPPAEETPFTFAAIRAPAPQDALCKTPEECAPPSPAKKKSWGNYVDARREKAEAREELPYGLAF